MELPLTLLQKKSPISRRKLGYRTHRNPLTEPPRSGLVQPPFFETPAIRHLLDLLTRVGCIAHCGIVLVPTRSGGIHRQQFGAAKSAFKLMTLDCLRRAALVTKV